MDARTGRTGSRRRRAPAEPVAVLAPDDDTPWGANRFSAGRYDPVLTPVLDRAHDRPGGTGELGGTGDLAGSDEPVSGRRPRRTIRIEKLGATVVGVLVVAALVAVWRGDSGSSRVATRSEPDPVLLGGALPGSPDSRYRTMTDYLDAADRSVRGYWVRRLGRRGGATLAPSTTWATRTNAPDANACGEGIGPAYCPADDTIVFDLPTARDLWVRGLEGRASTRPGSFAVAIVLAHEYGHAVQFFLAANDQSDAGDSMRRLFARATSSRRVELLADCMAGIWLGDAARHGRSGTDQAAQSAAAMKAAGDYDFEHPQHHGTPAERSRAMAHGFNSGSCGRYGLELG